jgi:phosphopantetheinyl transferase
MTKNTSKYSKILEDIDLLHSIETEVGKLWVYNLNNYNMYRSSTGKKNIEKIVKQLILLFLFDTAVKISNNHKGAPILNGTNDLISISHSHSLFAFYTSNEIAIGIDIERKRQIKTTGFDYFLNNEEQKKTWTQDELLTIWGAKEAYYKMKLGNIEDLKNALTTISITNNQLMATDTYNSYIFDVIQKDIFTLVYCNENFG